MYVLGSTGSGLYLVDEAQSLFSVNPSNAAATLIGPTATPTYENWYALSGSGSSLYFGDETNLYSLNMSTGAATLVGGYGDPIAGEGAADMGALVFENGVLYGAQEAAAGSIPLTPVPG